MAIKVEVKRVSNGFQVRWGQGVVTVRTQKHAAMLKANVERVGARSWAKGWVMMPDPGKYASQGGTARAAGMTSERRKEIGRIAAAKRWGKTIETAPLAVEEV